MNALAVIITDPSFRTFSVRLNDTKIPVKIDGDKFIIDWEIPPNTTGEEQVYVFDLFEDGIYTGKQVEITQTVDHWIVAVHEDGTRENIYSVPISEEVRVPVFPKNYVESEY